MKMKPEDYKKFSALITKGNSALPVEMWQSNKALIEAGFYDRCKDVEVFYRWTIFNRANDILIATGEKSIIDTLNLYSYLDDTHIDTALKQYVKDNNL